VERDLALLLPAGVTVASADGIIRQAARKFLQDVTVFDVYEGEGIGEGVRSVAFRLHFQSWERTLTDKEVDKAVDRAAGRLKEELGVEIRGR
jgi:phenylalanyl-tRNA synthetase beta chain